jgi:hypothetical protein
MVQRKKRPFTITVLAWLYVAVGAIGTAGHYANFWTHKPTADEFFWISVLGAAAIIAGAFMLRGHNWARWLALTWMAAHVAISVFHPMRELIVHCAMLVLIAYLLFRREAGKYFSAG